MSSPLHRILGFFATLVFLSLCVGILASRADIPKDRTARGNVIIALTAGTVAASYVLGYRPGYLVRWLLDKDEDR